MPRRAHWGLAATGSGPAGPGGPAARVHRDTPGCQCLTGSERNRPRPNQRPLSDRDHDRPRPVARTTGGGCHAGGALVALADNPRPGPVRPPLAVPRSLTGSCTVRRRPHGLPVAFRMRAPSPLWPAATMMPHPACQCQCGMPLHSGSCQWLALCCLVLYWQLGRPPQSAALLAWVLAGPPGAAECTDSECCSWCGLGWLLWCICA